jgi:hypothetical protein
LRGTWEDYLRPKYKKALDKWNKDTGGGDGNPTHFIDFCAGNRWLVYLFCKDSDTNFLLASNAGGRMPRHLQLESGFDDLAGEVLSLEGSSNNNSSAAKRDRIEDELVASRQQR